MNEEMNTGYEEEEAEYYLAHCSGCGEATPADLLAFDFGKLINNAIEKQGNRKLGKNDTWSPMLKVDFALYLTWRDLQSEYELVNGEMSHFVFKVDNLKEHVKAKTGLSFEEIIRERNTDSVTYAKLVRAFRPPFITGKKATRQNVEDREMAENLQEVFQAVERFGMNNNGIIAEFDVAVIFEKDDHEFENEEDCLEFAKKLEVRYEDDEVETVIHNVCPNCGRVFYSEVGKHEETIIGMAGSARVGKTAYLAALVDKIQTNGNDFLTIIPSDDPEWTFFRDHILEKYKNQEKIDKTAFEGSKETIPLFSLEIKVGDRHRIFTFIDMPGEAYTQDGNAGNKFILNNRRIIRFAQMIWFCIDPNQIDSKLAIQYGDATDQQEQVNTKTDQVMANIRRTMESVCLGDKKNAAVLVTKSDRIPELADGFKLFQPKTKVMDEYLLDGDALDTRKMVDFSARAGEYICKASDIKVTLEQMFRNYQFFAVAAYGQDVNDSSADVPDFGNLVSDSGTAAKPAAVNMPSMIELPFLWTLAEQKIIDAKQAATFIREETRGKFIFKKTETIRTEGFVDSTKEELYSHEELGDIEITDTN